MGKNITQILLEADAAKENGDWGKARQLYRQISEHPRTAASLVQLDNLEATDKRVQELIRQGDAKKAERQFKKAADKYIQALNQAGHVGILKYHAQMEKQAQEMNTLYDWQTQIASALDEVRRLQRENRLPEASKLLDDLLHRESDGDLYREISTPAKELLDNLDANISDEEHCNLAERAFSDENFKLAIRLVGLVGEDSKWYGRAKDILIRATESYEFLKPMLEKIENFYQSKQWDDAFDELETASIDFQNNPDLRQLWLKVGKAQGMDALNMGRQANARREFNGAVNHFTIASDAFAHALEKYPEHKTLLSLRKEAMELAQIAAQAGKADKLWKHENHKEAKKLLNQTLSTLQQAENQGRNYATMTGVVQTMLSAIKEETQKIQEVDRKLENGAQFFEEKCLQEAKDAFQGAFDEAVLQNQEERASQGLNQAKNAIEQFDTDMERGKTADIVDDKVKYYKHAYECWSSGPEVKETLENTLLQAGEEFWVNNDQRKALEHFKYILTYLNPENDTAKDRIAQSDLAPRVDADLTNIEQRLQDLLSKKDLRANEFKGLLDELGTLEQETKRFKKLHRRVKDLSTRVKNYFDGLKEFERLYQVAQKNIGLGLWNEGVADLEKAIQSLPDDVTSKPTQKLDNWKDICNRVEQAQKTAHDTLAQVRELYAAIPDSGDFSSPLAMLQQTEQDFSNLSDLIINQDGGLPADIKTLLASITQLINKLSKIQDAYSLPRVWESLATLQFALDEESDDPILQALVAEFTQRTQQEAVSLLNDADDAIKAGKFEDADKLLQHIPRLHISDEEFTQRYRTLKRSRKLKALIEQVEQDAESKLMTSGIPASNKALEDGLRELTSLGDVPGEVRKVINKLFKLKKGGEGAEAGLVLGTKEGYERTQSVVDELIVLAGDDQILLDIYKLAVKWIDDSYTQSQLGLIDSHAAFGQVEDAYKIAVEYSNAHSTDETAIKKLAETRENLLKDTYVSVRKRLDRAKKAIEQGNFQPGLDDLESIETEFIREFKEEFPGLLTNEFFMVSGQESVTIEYLQDETEALTRRLKGLIAQEEKIKPAIDSIREQLEAISPLDKNAQNILEALARGLHNISVSDDLPKLREYQNNLRKRLDDKNAQIIEHILNEDWHRLQKQFDKANRIEDFKAIYRLIDEKQQYEVAWEKAPSYIRDKLQALRNQSFDKFSSLKQTRDLAVLADEAEKQGKVEQAIDMLRALLDDTDDIRTKFDIKERLKKLNLRVSAKQFLNQKDYSSATDKLLELQERGESVDGWLKVARIGTLYQNASRMLEQGQSDIAEKHLQTLMNLVESIDLSVDEMKTERGRIENIIFNAQQLQNEVESLRQHQEKFEDLLSNASSALLRYKLDEANKYITEAMKIDKEDERVINLKQRIDKTFTAVENLKQARELFTKGSYSAASEIVDNILAELPDFADASALKGNIAREIEKIEADKRILEKVGKLLNQAKFQADSNNFKESKNKLAKAIEEGANSAQIEETQTYLVEQERQWRAKTIRPIENAIKEGEYSNAIDICKTALLQVSDSNFKKKLEGLQSTIVEKWLEAKIKEHRQQISKLQDENTLKIIISELERLQRIKPEPPQPLRKELDVTIKEIKRKLGQVVSANFEHRLMDVDKTVASGQFSLAKELAQQIENEIKEIRHSQKLAVGTILTRTQTLLIKIDRLADEQERQQRQQQYETLLENARFGLMPDANKRQIEKALGEIEEVFDIKGYQQDGDAEELRNKLNKGLEKFQKTEQALLNMKDRIEKRLYDEALVLIEEQDVAPQFKERYAGFREITQTLFDANRYQMDQLWKKALEEYENERTHHLISELDLRINLSEDVERCRRYLMQGVLLKVDKYLKTAPPKPEEARRELEKAQSAGWFLSALNNDIARIQANIECQTKVAKATELLLGESADVDDALQQLTEARDLLPEGEDDFAIRQWENFAYAQRSFSMGNLLEARSKLATLQPPLTDITAVKKLAQHLDNAWELRERFVTLEKEIQKFTDVQPAQYKKAVDVLLNARSELGEDVRYDKLIQSTRQTLLSEIENMRHLDDYGQAIELARLLARLMVDDAQEQEDTRRISKLINERQTTLKDLLNKIEKTLNSFDFDSNVEEMLERAKRIAVPDGHSRLLDLKHYLTEQKQKQTDINKQLERILDFISSDSVNWESIVSELSVVKKSASGYKRVEGVIQVAQNTMYEQARMSLEQKAYQTGLNLCDLALRLNVNSDVADLKMQIQHAYQLQIAEIQSKIINALNIWNINEAKSLIEEARLLASADETLERLIQQTTVQENLIPKVSEEMRLCWDALDKRDYSQLREHCTQLIEEMSPLFSEAELWQSYSHSLEALSIGVKASNWKQIESGLAQLDWSLDEMKRAFFTPIPEWLPGLSRERKKALWNGQLVRNMVVELMALYKNYTNTPKSPEGLEKRSRYWQQMGNKRKEFEREIVRVKEAPVSYDPDEIKFDEKSNEIPSIQDNDNKQKQESLVNNTNDDMAIPVADGRGVNGDENTLSESDANESREYQESSGDESVAGVPDKMPEVTETVSALPQTTPPVSEFPKPATSNNEDVKTSTSSDASTPITSQTKAQDIPENNQEFSEPDEMSEEEKMALENYLKADDPYADEEDEDSGYSGWGDMNLPEYDSDE